MNGPLPETSPPVPRGGQSLRRGLTLVELLVVITIMMLLAAFVLPKFQLNSKTRKIREAARMISVYLGVARNRAVETNRKCGIMLQRLANQPRGAAMLFQVEVPPLYAGDTMDARVRVQYIPGAVPGSDRVFIQEELAGLNITNTLVRIGDKIQFNGQGPWYEIIGPDALNEKGEAKADGVLDPPASGPVQMLARVDPAYWNRVPWTSSSAPVPFQIERQPLETMAPPVELPTDTVVDLDASGTNENPGLFGTGAGSVIVMFSPSGNVSEYYYTNYAGTRESRALTEPMFFLVGKESQLGEGPAAALEANEEKLENWRILTNLWVAINPQSGLVSVAENAATPNWLASFASATAAQGIDEARTFAKQARNMGGR
ncbi:MAG: prepilin-type N-terminal cleavage/methylation domain-containing protein [Planctomycetia bacterium]|nr:prepilin-type N-terminal cleavage/methylation domain-containing protein [Planctomycetia bacterium]